MRELIQLLKEAGVCPATLTCVKGMPLPTLVMWQQYVHFYQGTIVDEQLSKLVDDGLIVINVIDGNAYIWRP